MKFHPDLFTCKFSTLGFFILLELINFGHGLSCYRCLNLDCKSDVKVCQEIRDFITEELRVFYYIDKFLPNCPDPQDELRWKIMQIASSPCNSRRADYATCALSRFQVITELSPGSSFTTYGTVMGCAHDKLLTSIKHNIENMRSNKCALNARNVTLEKKLLTFYYELETCHVSTEYCTEDFCVAPLQSSVRPFKNQKVDRSFESGSIILIVSLIVVLIIAVMLASMCRSPMNWVSNSYNVNRSSVSDTNNSTRNNPDFNNDFTRITTEMSRDKLKSKYPPGLALLAQALNGRQGQVHPPPLRHVTPNSNPAQKPPGLLQEMDEEYPPTDDIQIGRRTFSTFRDEPPLSSEC